MKKMSTQVLKSKLPFLPAQDSYVNDNDFFDAFVPSNNVINEEIISNDISGASMRLSNISSNSESSQSIFNPIKILNESQNNIQLLKVKRENKIAKNKKSLTSKITDISKQSDSCLNQNIDSQMKFKEISESSDRFIPQRV